jgi:ribosome recycling factor
MFDQIKKVLEDQMKKSMDSFKQNLTKIRTGRASASVLDNVKVDYYGTLTPLKQVGQISTPEARLLQIQPFDKGLIGNIEKAILAANLGLTPANDGNLIRITFPSLTEERRKEQVKEIKKYGEEAKVAIRNSRRIQNDQVKALEKSKTFSEDLSKKYQQEIQKLTDAFIEQIDKMVRSKEQEQMEV